MHRILHFLRLEIQLFVSEVLAVDGVSALLEQFFVIQEMMIFLGVKMEWISISNESFLRPKISSSPESRRTALKGLKLRLQQELQRQTTVFLGVKMVSWKS